MDHPRWAALLEGWRQGQGALYTQLARSLQAKIEAGQLAGGEQLPAERALAELLGISRSSVVAAYDHLAAGNWVTRRRGSGTHVAPHAPRQAEVLALRTPVQRPYALADELDFTHAVPYLTPAHRDQMREAAQDAFHESLYHPLGLMELRDLLAQQYTREGLPTRAEQVFVTNGAQQAISLIAGALLRRGDVALLETPTYFGAIDVFRASGAELVGVPVEADGVRADVIQQAAKEHGPRLAFLTPTFQNPTGTVMPERTRQRVAQFIADSDLPTIEDDTLIDLSFGAAPPPRVATFAPGAPIVNVGSLSKLYWAGLRVGWMRVPDRLHAPLMQAKTLSDFGGSLPSQHVALKLLSDWEGLRRERRENVTRARDLLAQLLRQNLPEWTFAVPSGGQFLWVELPTPHASHFTHQAARYGVRLFPGASMGVAELPDRYLRLPFTLDPERLPEAVARLKAAWDDFGARHGGERLA